MRQLRRLVPKPRVVLLVAAGLFCIGEVTLRLLYYEQLKTRAYPLVYQPDERVGYRYVPGIESEICVPSICKRISINENGFYGPGFSRQKEPGTFRIAIVAASIGTGIWLDGEESFSVRLQDLFSEAGAPVEVLNFSIDGRFRDVENLHLIEDTVVGYEPDLVLLNTALPFLYGNLRREVYRGYVLIYSGSDPRSLALGKAHVDYILKHWWATAAHRLSFIVRAGAYYYLNHWETSKNSMLETFVKKRYQCPGVQFIPRSVRRSGLELQKTRDMLRARGSELAIFLYRPAPNVRRYLEHFELSYVDLELAPTRELVHEHDGHFNEKGHRLIAERLFAYLVGEGLVPDRTGGSWTMRIVGHIIPSTDPARCQEWSG